MAFLLKFGVEVNFLTGRYVATAYNNRRQGEWPPHPARLFSAIVNAWAEQDDRALQEGRILEWLEALGPPAIAASEAEHRRVVSHFVPVNDVSVIGPAWQERRFRKIQQLENEFNQAIALSSEESRKAQSLRNRLSKARGVESQVTKAGTTNPSTAQAMFPELRLRQERFFPSVTPIEPRVTYLWNAPLSEEMRAALDELLSRVTRLGHSSSLVSCRLADSLPEATLVPDAAIGTKLRTTQTGQFKELERMFQKHGGNGPRLLPFSVTTYGPRHESPEASEFIQRPNTVGEWIVFELEHGSLLDPGSRWLPMTRGAELTSAMRDAVIQHAASPVPAEISGYGSDGKPTDGPHLAFLSLPLVGSQYADGRVMGVALSIPEGVSDRGRQSIFRAIGAWEQSSPDRRVALQLAGGGVTVRLKRLQETPETRSLRLNDWRRKAQWWISATPIALPRHPGRLSGGTAAARAKAWKLAEKAVVASCKHVGLPAPLITRLSLSPSIRGGRHVRDFPPFRRRGRQGEKLRRQLVHAVLAFREPVGGPIILGAGRFAGLGLMRPISESEGRTEGETNE